MGVMQENDNGTVTFQLKGYQPVVCRLIGESVSNGLSVRSYETSMDGESRTLLNSELVSRTINRLKYMAYMD